MEKDMKEVAMEFRFVQNSMFIKDIYINNAGPFDFLVSSDTTNTTLDKAMANKLELVLEKVGMGIGLGGQVPIFKTSANLQVGKLEIKNFTFLVTDLSQISTKFGLNIVGVIANDILRNFKAVIDYGNNQLKLRKST